MIAAAAEVGEDEDEEDEVTCDTLTDRGEDISEMSSLCTGEKWFALDAVDLSRRTASLIHGSSPLISSLDKRPRLICETMQSNLNSPNDKMMKTQDNSYSSYRMCLFDLNLR